MSSAVCARGPPGPPKHQPRVIFPLALASIPLCAASQTQEGGTLDISLLLQLEMVKRLRQNLFVNSLNIRPLFCHFYRIDLSAAEQQILML